MPTPSTSDGSDSVCTQPPFAPVYYHWYQMTVGLTLLAEVKKQAIDAGVPPTDVDRLVGEFRARGRALVQGKLTPIKHIKGPMLSVTDVDIYEIRAGIEYGESLEIHARAYHVEPNSLRRRPGSTIVGLHVHVKDLAGSAHTILLHQNVELQKARERFHQGRSSSWGGASLIPLPSELV